MAPQYTTVGGYPNTDPYYVSPEEETEMEDRQPADEAVEAAKRITGSHHLYRGPDGSTSFEEYIDGARPAMTADSPERRDRFLKLADRCEKEEPSFALDTAIESMCWGVPGRIPPLPYTGSLTAAARISNWILLHASDIGADGLPLVVLGDPSPGDGVKEVKGLAGRTLELTWCAAALRARAEEERAT